MPRKPSALDAVVRGAREHYEDALYYDYTYRRRTEDIAFYRRFVRQHGERVLEIGGGTGRVAIPLVKDGATVTVLDASPEMLARARERAASELTADERKRLTLVHGDMREFALGKRFDLVLAPFNVLLHLYEPQEFASCFRAVARHFARDARFVFDVRVPDPRELARDPDRWYKSRPFRHPTLGHKIEYTERFRYDPLKQVQHVTIRFTPGAGSPRDARPVEVLLSQRQIFPNELRALLALGGLRLAGRYGDFTARPLDPGDPIEIIVAQRA